MICLGQPASGRFAALCVVFALVAGPARAGVIYVDNLRGDDAFNGIAEQATSQISGPVRTLGRAMQLMRPGDTLNVANTGQPYYGSLELAGGKLSGIPLFPLIVEGNGSELNGALAVPANAWKRVGDQLWSFAPLRKGHYLLILDNQALPEVPIPPGTRVLPVLPERHWAAWRGSIYFRTKVIEDPIDLNLGFAVRSMGVTLYDVHDVVVRNLKVRHFRIDGINAHDRCQNVVLDNVTVEENGRAGVVAAGTSVLSLVKPTIRNNRKYSVLITEKATVRIDDETQVAPAPTIAE